MTVLKDLFSSKKFLVMLAAIVMAAASKLGLALDPELVNQILALAGAFIVGQGIADHGKEAAKVNAAAGPVKTTVTETEIDGNKQTTTITANMNPLPVTAPIVPKETP